jgi:hypothetical protein
MCKVYVNNNCTCATPFWPNFYFCKRCPILNSFWNKIYFTIKSPIQGSDTPSHWNARHQLTWNLSLLSPFSRHLLWLLTMTCSWHSVQNSFMFTCSSSNEFDINCCIDGSTYKLDRQSLTTCRLLGLCFAHDPKSPENMDKHWSDLGLQNLRYPVPFQSFPHSSPQLGTEGKSLRFCKCDDCVVCAKVCMLVVLHVTWPHNNMQIGTRNSATDVTAST